MSIKELVAQYCSLIEAKEDIDNKIKDTLDLLSKESEHKVGEMAKWKETGRTKVVNEFSYNNLPDKEHIVVLTNVSSRVFTHFDINGNKVSEIIWDYDFHKVKSDGEISKKSTYISNTNELVWLGEIHNYYKKKADD